MPKRQLSEEKLRKRIHELSERLANYENKYTRVYEAYVQLDKTAWFVEQGSWMDWTLSFLIVTMLNALVHAVFPQEGNEWEHFGVLAGVAVGWYILTARARYEAGKGIMDQRHKLEALLNRAKDRNITIDPVISSTPKKEKMSHHIRLMRE